MNSQDSRFEKDTHAEKAQMREFFSKRGLVVKCARLFV